MRSVRALLHQLGAVLLRGGDLEASAADRPPSAPRARGTRRLAAISTKLGFAFLTLSRSPLMSRISLTSSTVPFSQVAMIRRCAPAPAAPWSSAGDRHSALIDVGLDVDERAQALVLAEVAAGGFVAGGLVAESSDTASEPDEGGLPAVVPQPPGFERRADRAGFAAMLVHDDFGRTSLPLNRDSMKSTCAFTAARLYCVPPCSRKRVPMARDVRNLRNVQPDVLRQHVAQAGHDLFRLPSLALEIDDVGLHEYRAAIAELRDSRWRRRRCRRYCSTGTPKPCAVDCRK